MINEPHDYVFNIIKFDTLSKEQMEKHLKENRQELSRLDDMMKHKDKYPTEWETDPTPDILLKYLLEIDFLMTLEYQKKYQI